MPSPTAAPPGATRVLILTDDPICADFLAARLEASGAETHTMRTGESVLALLEARVPDALVIDPGLPTIDALEVIRRLRSRETCRDLPIHVLGSGIGALTQNAMTAGATRVLSPGGGLVAQAEELREALGLPVPIQNLAVVPSALLDAVVKGAPELLANARRTLQTLTRNRRDLGSVRELFLTMGILTRRTQLAGLPAIHRLAAALEGLLHAIYEHPARMGATTLQTISQAFDLLARLLQDRRYDLLADPRGAEVFVLDDDAEARDVITISLNYAGLSGMAAGDPVTALAILARQRFDLLFFDVNVPGMSGFELCARLRGLPANAATPVVFITGEPTLLNRAQSTISGGSDFIAKPFSIGELAVKATQWVIKGRLDGPAAV